MMGNVVTGNVALSGNTSFSANAANGSITATTFVGALSGAATTAGTVTTAAQPNITSVGTLSGLTVSATITGSVSGSAGTAGTVTTAAQPNITSVGTLTSLAVTGNANVGNLNSSGRVRATGELISDGGASEGGQIVLGWVNTTGITGQANSTWNIDVDNANNYRIFYQNASGTTGVALTAYSANANLLAGANLTVTGYVARSVGLSLLANGSTQGTATALTKEINIVSSVSSGQGVILPNGIQGLMITITNASANSLLVYPGIAGSINSLVANSAYTQPAGSTLQFVTGTGTQWYTVGATYA
jgi:hypothetical protein